jgi:tRNA(Ile)-lysidine synthetase-like protein
VDAAGVNRNKAAFPFGSEAFSFSSFTIHLSALIPVSTPSFLPSLLQFWSDEGFDPAGKTLVLGISGGADSVALLELFVREASPRLGCTLFAVHVNHRLRPDAGLDQAFVEELCADRGVPLRVETLDPASRRRGQSIEMWGREQRYAAFARAAASCGAAFILTAHHRDDAVETACLRLWRGTGLAGLAGIAFLRADGVVRPLLPVPRAALRPWLRSLGTPWREDESNADTRVPRNWLRHRLLPAWRAADPELDARVFRITRDVAALRPAWERWMREEHPEDEVRERGGIPVEWLRDGMDAATLKALLPALGITDPGPELAAEILRQAAGKAGKIRARADESTVLGEKRGVLAATRSIFKRHAPP